MTDNRSSKPEQARATSTRRAAPLVPRRIPFPASNAEARVRHWKSNAEARLRHWARG